MIQEPKIALPHSDLLVIESSLAEANNKLLSMQLSPEFDSQSQLSVVYQEKQIEGETKYKSRIISTDGLCIIETSIFVNRDMTNLLSIKGPHVKITFLFDGTSLSAGMEKEAVADTVSMMGKVKVIFGENTNFNLPFPGRHNSYMVSIIMSRHYYLELSRNELLSHNFSLFTHVKQSLDFDSNAPSLRLNLPLRHVLRKIIDNPFVGKLKRHYVDSKIKGLLSLMHEQEMHNMPALQQVHDENIEKLYQARDILTLSYQNPPTIKKLSKMIVLNELKLKKGFKNLFGTTIHSYLTKLRMEAAHTMMNENNVLIFEVAMQLGYKDTSHFIKTFKKYYGYTPKYFCKNVSATRGSTDYLSILFMAGTGVARFADFLLTA